MIFVIYLTGNSFLKPAFIIGDLEGARTLDLQRDRLAF